ncbi:MAG: preprotein translocase subunit YajC [Odoribacteraceae bacterium]|jgi:preprotein translocase subunit YajC|nr:preprotein translocase subunit YajC [Odoribacteraceae bacterium]
MMNTYFILPLAETESVGWMEQMAPFLLILVVFWFFMIRPQMKRQKELRKYRETLQKGDRVVTTGGIFGKVLEIGDHTVIIEVENQGRLKVLKDAIVKDASANQPAR